MRWLASNIGGGSGGIGACEVIYFARAGDDFPAGPALNQTCLCLITASGRTQGHKYQWSGAAWVDQGLITSNSDSYIVEAASFYTYIPSLVGGGSPPWVIKGVSSSLPSNPIDAVASNDGTSADPANTSTGAVAFVTDPLCQRTGGVEIEIDAGGVLGAATFKWRFQGGAWNLGVATAASVNITNGAGFTMDVTFGAGNYVLADKWSTNAQLKVYVAPGTLATIGAFDLVTPGNGAEFGMVFAESFGAMGDNPLAGTYSIIGAATAGGYTQGKPAYAQESGPGVFENPGNTFYDPVSSQSPSGWKFANVDAINALDGKVVIAFVRNRL